MDMIIQSFSVNDIEVVYDHRAHTNSFGDNGLEYEWIFQDASGRMKTRMTNEIREGYYFIDVYMEKGMY